MLIYTTRLLAACLLLAASLGAQQTPEETVPAPQETPKRTEPASPVSAPVLTTSQEPDASDIPIEQRVVPVPAIIGGFAPTLAFSSAADRANLLRIGFNVGGSYDDNALITPTNAISNWSYSIFPNISIQQTRSRLRWDLTYAGGVTVNEEFSANNQGSHDLNLNLLYRLSPHVNLILSDHFTITSGIFDQLGSNATPTPGASGAASGSAVLPISNQLNNSTSAQLGYQFSANDAVGVSGTYFLANYRDVPVGTQLFDTRSAQVAGFYTHRVTPRNWAGISYRFARLTFTEDSGETLINSILLFDTITLPGKISVSFFAGPESVDVTSPLVGTSVSSPEGKQWSVAAGASFNWTGQRTSLFGDFTRRTNDGGGLQGPTQSISFNGGVREKLGRFWTLSGTGSFGKNDSLTEGPTIPDSIQFTSLSASVERKIRESIALLAGYSHEIQKGQDFLLPDENAHRNRVWFSISYSFARPLGR